jgi:hypothetical protein
MAVERKLEAPVTLFAAIEAKQHEALREIAFREKRSLADLAREALDALIRSRSKKHKVARA